ncbi:MAG TPA: hypothetical protein PK509_06980, partial [Catalimonadaceae bacterium]|nr:hypothetical protein [Catalimonadaceae bacterium]
MNADWNVLESRFDDFMNSGCFTNDDFSKVHPVRQRVKVKCLDIFFYDYSLQQTSREIVNLNGRRLKEISQVNNDFRLKWIGIKLMRTSQNIV